ncbi:hypothetical protein [Streptomyces sp. NPDC054940]
MAGARTCRTPAEAFRAGWEEPCDHGHLDPGECPECALTDAEIARLVALLGNLAAPSPAGSAAA